MIRLVELQIRTATKIDVVEGSGLKLGVTYYVESYITPGVFCGPMVTADYTNLTEFKMWYQDKRVYVNVWAIDNIIRESKF